MTSGPGTTGKTDVPPDEAIEEISGLLEMDEMNAGESKTADSSEEPEAAAEQFDTHAMGGEIDLSMETPSPAKLDSYLVPPPGGDEPPTGPEAESASSTNLAYEDLLEKLVLPATPSAPDESEAAEEPPPFASTEPSSPHLSSSSGGNLYQPGPGTSEESTVVTANPLLAEEQEAAAREAENYILPPAAVVTPVFAQPPVVAQPVRATFRTPSLDPNKVVQISYQKFGIMLLAALFLGGVFTRLVTPTRVVVSVPPPQTPTLVARPVVPVQPTQPVNPAPQVVPLPNPAEPAAPAPPAARQAAAAEAKPSVGIPPAEPASRESGEGGAKTVTKAKVHHAAKSPRPPKSAAPKAAPAKPAAPKKPAKGGWVDPFAQQGSRGEPAGSAGDSLLPRC